MSQDRRSWVRWVQILADPSAANRGFSLEGLEFRASNSDPVEDVMYGTLAGDAGNKQPGKFWVVPEDELMRVCPKMAAFAQGKDWFFPVEFCESMVRPPGFEEVMSRDATETERAAALSTFEHSRKQQK